MPLQKPSPRSLGPKRASRDSGGPSSGEPDSPKDIWAAEGTKDPKQLGGFQLALTLDEFTEALTADDRGRALGE